MAKLLAVLAVLVAPVIVLVASPAAIAQEGTEDFTNAETKRISAELEEKQSRLKEIEAEKENLEPMAKDRGRKVNELNAERNELNKQVKRLNADLGEAGLEAIKDAPVEGETDEEQIASLKAKRDALGALEDWTRGNPDLIDTGIGARQELRATESGIENLQQKQQKRSEGVGGGGAGSDGTPGSEEGSGGTNPLPLLLLVGGALFVALRFGVLGNARRWFGTPMAPRPAAAVRGSAGAGPPGVGVTKSMPSPVSQAPGEDERGLRSDAPRSGGAGLLAEPPGEGGGGAGEGGGANDFWSQLVEEDEGDPDEPPRWGPPSPSARSGEDGNADGPGPEGRGGRPAGLDEAQVPGSDGPTDDRTVEFELPDDESLPKQDSGRGPRDGRCPSCGREVGEGAKFCGYCKHPLEGG